MNQNNFDKLVDNCLITDVNLTAYYKNNPEELDKLSVENLADMGIISNQSTYTEIIENGMDVLISEPVIISNQAELIEQLNTGYAKLSNDIVLDDVILWTEGETVLDLNGYKLTAGLFKESGGEVLVGDTDSYVLWATGGKITIQGTGELHTQTAKYAMAVWANGAEVIINGGSYYNYGEGSDLIYASGDSSIYINDGSFYPCEMLPNVPGTANKYCALNIKDRDRQKAKIEVTGGVFYNFDPMNNVSEGDNTNFVKDGYKSILIGENIYKVISN